MWGVLCVCVLLRNAQHEEDKIKQKDLGPNLLHLNTHCHSLSYSTNDGQIETLVFGMKDT